MFATIRHMITILQTKPEQVRGICYLPPKPAPKAYVPPPPPTPSIYEIDKDRQFFGFHMKEAASREGAVKHCTQYDKDALRTRLLWGGKKVVSQNEACKALWYAGESVADACKTIGLSDSWVEKRFAAFGAALSLELRETAK